MKKILTFIVLISFLLTPSLYAQSTTVQSFKAPLAVTLGGTGKLTVTANSFLKGNGTGTLVERTYAEVRTDLGLATTDSPVFATIKLSGLTDGYIPYHSSDAVGLVDSPLFTDGTDVGLVGTIGATTGIFVNLTDGKIPYHVDDETGLADGPAKTDVDSAVSLKHTQGTDTTLGNVTANINMNTHKLTSLSVPADAGDSIRATTKITEANLEDAVDKKHVAVTVSAPISLSGQALSLVNNAGSPATVTTIDIDGTLAGNSDVYVPTQKAVKTYADLKLAKASNLSDVANTATAFTNIKQSATESATGVAELATVAEAIAGTDTSRITTPAGVAAATAILKNPLAFAQGVKTLYSTTVGGLAVTDNDNLDVGINNFTLFWRGTLPDWTPSATTYLLAKGNNNSGIYGYLLTVLTDGKLFFRIAADPGTAGTTTKTFFSTVATGLTDNTNAEIVVVITRPSISTAGSVVFYVNGYQLGASVPATAEAPESLNNNLNLLIAGSSSETKQYEMTTSFAGLANRALSAAEVLSLYRHGIDYADMWGSQTSIITGNDSTFAGASNWANVDINSYDETTGEHLTITANAAGQYCTLPVANATTVIGKKYRLTYTVSSIAATWTITDFTGTGQTIGTVSADGTTSIEFTAATTGGLRLVSVANNSSGVFDNVLLYEIGATLALESEGIQRDAWKDSSTNGLNASYPASGYSFLRPIRTDSAEGLLSVTNVSLAADADTTLYTVPTGKRLVLTKAIIVVGADAGTSVISIGADGAETDWLPNNTLSALDAAYDAAILVPVPNTTPTLIKSYAAGTVVQAKVSSHAGGATNSLSLFGYLY